MNVSISPRSFEPYCAPAAAAMVLLSLGAGPQRADAQGTVDLGDTYTWSANVVSYDDAAQAVTLEARLEAHAEIEDLDEFEDGDRLTLIWTGRQWAAGVRGIERDPDLPPGALTLPIEFAASEGEYVEFRVSVPDEAVDFVRDLEPGTPVTGTSPRTEADFSDGVVALRHYNDVG